MRCTEKGEGLVVPRPSVRSLDSGARLGASLVVVLVATLCVVGCSQRMDSPIVESLSLAVQTPRAAGAASSGTGMSSVGERAPVAALPSGDGAGVQAGGAWPPPCHARNRNGDLHRFFESQFYFGTSGKPRGVQTELQWLSDGSEVLFASGTRVYAVTADGARLDRLINAPTETYLDQSRYSTQPITAVAMSPDGERIAYAVCHWYAPDWTNPRDPDVARCRRGLHFGAVNTDDERFCYELREVVRDYLAGPVQLPPGVLFDEILLWNRASLTTVPLAGGYAPAWSPDGTRLAFLSEYSDAYDPERKVGYRRRLPGLYVMSADTWELQSHVRADVIRPPRWSPDGRLLAIVEEAGAEATLSVVSADGKGRRRLSETRSNPAWSPDGSRIAFVRAERGEFVLYTIAPDGTDERRITAYRLHLRDWWDPSVAWSPDGTMLLYGCGGICVVTRDGLRVGWRTLPSREGYSAAWSPDGDRIAVLSVGADLGRAGPRVLVTTTPDGNEPQVLVVHDDEHGLLGIGVDGDSEPVDVSGCASGTTVPAPAANLGLVRDCEVLLQARPVLEGSVEGALNWSPERPITEWDGVVVGGTPPRVHGLSLTHPHINGRIPSALAGLAHLRELELGGYLGGELPPALAELANLEALHLHGSYIHGSIPTELGQLAQLEELVLWHTIVSGSIPAELAELPQLRSLSFGHNSFLTGPIPPELGRLANLENLGLQDNRLTGPIPAELGQLANLRTLVLKSNQLTGPIPSELDALTKLEHLELGGNELTGCVPSELRVRLGLADCR